MHTFFGYTAKNGNVILTKSSSLVTPDIVKMIAFCATSDKTIRQKFDDTLNFNVLYLRAWETRWSPLTPACHLRHRWHWTCREISRDLVGHFEKPQLINEHYTKPLGRYTIGRYTSFTAIQPALCLTSMVNCSNGTQSWALQIFCIAMIWSSQRTLLLTWINFNLSMDK